MGIDDACNTGLVLGLGFSSTMELPSKLENKNPSFLKLEATSFDDEPSLTLSLSDGCVSYQVTAASAIQKVDVKPATVAVGDMYRQASPLSTVSSFSIGRLKRERELSEDENEGFNGRKKLRLSKKQSDLLEESFKQLSTLNPKQKQALARQLNLRTRQVEVWFQNRRARTKLKQTEVDCEFLKKCCETLTVENRRLQKEVQELKALKFAQPFSMHMQASTLTICPCEKTGDANSKNQFSMASKPHRFYNNPLTDSSAAC